MTPFPRIDEGLDAAVQSVLDGTADEATRTRLQAQMSEDAELRAYYETMARTFASLDEMEMIEVPEDLRSTVREKIETSRDEAPVHRPRRASRWRPDRLGARGILAAGAVAAALALVILIPQDRWLGGPSPESSVGSLLPVDPGGKLVDRMVWNETWGTVDSALIATDAGWRVRIQHRSSQPADVTFDLDSASWEVTAMDVEMPVEKEARRSAGRIDLDAGLENTLVLDIRAIGENPTSPSFRILVSTPGGSRIGQLTDVSGEDEDFTNFPR